MNATIDKSGMRPIPPLLLPPRLRRGDSIGLVAPAGSWSTEKFLQGVRIVDELGFQVKIPAGLEMQEHYLAGTDRHRAALFHAVWRDPDIKAVLAVRGGYGSLRLLPSIDFDLIRNCPKLFIGFSDITFLHQAIAGRTGLATLHGPMLTTLADSDRESVRTLFSTLSSGICEPIGGGSIEVLKAGTGRGALRGGNLTCAVHLLATPFEIPWQGALVVLEDVGESPYRIDRMLTQLQLAGRFEGIGGLLLGSFHNCGDEELIWSRVLELFADAPFPIWANLPFGHGSANRTLPLGVEAVMDSSGPSLRFNEPCCRND